MPRTAQQWAVRDDYFWCRMIYKKGEQRERGFLTGYSKAVQLKAAMETFVNIHLKVRHLLSSGCTPEKHEWVGAWEDIRTAPESPTQTGEGNQHARDLTADPPPRNQARCVVGWDCGRTPSWRRS